VTMTEEDRLELELLTHLEDEALDDCRENFYTFCQTAKPKFYKAHRKYLRQLCDNLQAFLEGRLLNPKNGEPYTKFIITMPPRHGKTLTVDNFCKWVFGKHPETSILKVSYDPDLSGRSSKEIRNSIQESRGDSDKFVFSDIFPDVRVKHGDADQLMWTLEGSHSSFLATSPGAKQTGFGAQIGIIDDIVKSAKEAYNAKGLAGTVDWYLNTYQARLEAGSLEIVMMTRWAPDDLVGWLLKNEPDLWFVMALPAHDEKTDTMLAPDILNRKEYMRRKAKADPMVFGGNYQQNPIATGAYLYTEFGTYRPLDLPRHGRREAYFDTADTGDDFLCGGTYILHDGKAYLTNVLYTQDGMDKTEPESARMLIAAKTDRAYIESNNGGRGFARNILALMVAQKFSSCQVDWFHQSENKMARILSNATSVTNTVVMPEDWATRWPDFYAAVTGLKKGGKWDHDDAPDFLTGVYEKSIASLPLQMSEATRKALAARAQG